MKTFTLREMALFVTMIAMIFGIWSLVSRNAKLTHENAQLKFALDFVSGGIAEAYKERPGEIGSITPNFTKKELPRE